MNPDDPDRAQLTPATYEDSHDSPQQPSGDIPTLILPSILLTCCCCFPFGVAALAHGFRVKSHLARGEFEAALEASEKARRLLKIGFIAGIAAAIVVMLLEMIASMG